MNRKDALSPGRSNLRTLLVLAAILAFVLAMRGVVVQTTSQQNTAESETTAALLDGESGEIVRLDWTYEGESSSLLLEDDVWISASEPDASIDQSSADSLVEALDDAVISRTIEDGTNIAGMGLDDSATTIVASFDDGSEITVRVGSSTSDGSSYYATSSTSEDILVIDDALTNAFSTTVSSLYVKEAPPSATTVSSLSLERADGNLVVFYSATGFSELYSSDYTWAFDDGTGMQAADSGTASTLASTINHATWVSCEDPSADDLSVYGFDDPSIIATLVYEIDSDDEGSTELGTYVLEIGNEKANGDYYARQQGSTAVYTMSGKDVDKLLQASAETLEADDVILMDWNTVESMEISMNGQSATVSFVRTNEGDEEDSEITTSYQIDGIDVDSQDAEAFLNALESLESEGSVDSSTGEQVASNGFSLSVTFYRNGSSYTEMTLGFSEYDNNFYLVSFNGKSTVLVNKNDVKELEELGSALLG